jgi:hypothetical protein
MATIERNRGATLNVKPLHFGDGGEINAAAALRQYVNGPCIKLSSGGGGGGGNQHSMGGRATVNAHAVHVDMSASTSNSTAPTVEAHATVAE